MPSALFFEEESTGEAPSPGSPLICRSPAFLSLIKCLLIELLSCKTLSRWQQLRRLAGCRVSDIDWWRQERTHGASPAKHRREKLKYQMCLEAARERRERGPGAKLVSGACQGGRRCGAGSPLSDSVSAGNKDSLLRGSLP